MNAKPKLIDYIWIQNNDLYKVTGEINSSNSNYSEINSQIHRYFIENIFTILYLMAFYGLISLYNIYLQVYQNITFVNYYGLNNPYGIGDTQLLSILFFFVFLIIWAIVIPIILKGIRYLLGLRWYFTRFKADNESDIQTKKAIINYYEFFNFYWSFKSDSLFHNESKKVKRIESEYYIQNKEDVLPGMNFVRNLYFVILESLPFVIIYFKMTMLSILLIAIISIIVIQVSAYLYWLRFKRREQLD